MKRVTKTRRSAADRWVEFRCGHRGYTANAGIDWKTAVCPRCGTRGIVSQQGPAGLEGLFRL